MQEKEKFYAQAYVLAQNLQSKKRKIIISLYYAKSS